MSTNILDYVKYYKEKSFDEVLFNQMDALVYSILVYLPVHKVNNGTKLSDLSKFVDSKNVRGAVGPIAIELLPTIEHSKRYKNIEIYDFSKIVNDEVQFGAVTFRSSANTFVAFEGTNSSVIGWVENFMVTSEYPTKTHVLAIEYINRVINDNDIRIQIGGHSKGGNLAMVASMEARDDIFNRIEKIYNFDGPGFRKPEFESDKFKKINSKTINILPEGSLIGILMYNKNYHFVNADGVGFKEHYPTSWNTFGEFFEPAKQGKSSKHIQESLYKSIDELKEEDSKKLLSAFTSFFIRNNIRNSSDIKNIKFDEFRTLAKEIKDVDENTKKLFFDIVRVLINPENNKEEKSKRLLRGKNEQ